MPIILLVFALALGTWTGWNKQKEPIGPSVRVEFIDVGQGDSILIKTPEGDAILIDAGEKEYGPKVVSHLRKLGVRRLRLVVMSHPHSDHIGGIPDVLNSFKVGGVLDSGYVHGTNTQERVLSIIEKKKIPYHRATQGMVFRFGDDVQLKVLAPGKQHLQGTSSDANNNSVVVQLITGRVKMLFPGDIERDGEGWLIASRQDIESQILKVAHHGASTSTSLEFLRLVKPEYVVISVGAGNEYGHPRKSTLKRLVKDRTGASMYRTDKNGTITIRTDGRRITVEAQNE
ncbi:MAG TPA: ComEC/Rec2 family competence protein [Armatimonadota bacterium]|nr:ComEC/Rec2 family competence protein [Armatimonadota bacterium]